VREALRHHAAGGHFLKAIVANRCRGAQRFVDVAGFELDAAGIEPAVLRRGMSPDAGEAVGLQFQRDRRAAGSGPAIARRLRVQPHQVLHVMTDFVRDDIRLRKVAGRAEALRQLVEERQIQIDLAVAGTIERPRGRLGEPAGRVDRIAKEKGWIFKQDGDKWRRVVPSPEPKRIFELRPIKWLLEHNTIVIAAGGGGIPTMYEPGAKRKLVGIECVIDKDLATELLARELDADLYVMLTDAEAVFVDWGKPTQKSIRRASPAALAKMLFAAGSMGPKVDAACRFVSATGKSAAIGALADLGKIIAGEAGTTVSAQENGIVYAAQ